MRGLHATRCALAASSSAPAPSSVRQHLADRRASPASQRRRWTTRQNQCFKTAQGRCTRGWSAGGLAVCWAAPGPDGAYQGLGRLGGAQK